MNERIYFKLASADIIRLARILEGCGHVGLLSTADSESGLCMIRTTSDRMAEVVALLEAAPLRIELASAPSN